MNSIEIKEERFDRIVPAKSKLSILLGMGSFVYALCDEQGKLIYYHHLAFENPDRSELILKQTLESTIQRSFSSKNEYSKIEIGVWHAPFTLVPEKFYADGQIHEYLSKVSQSTEKLNLGSELLLDADTRLVFGIPVEIFSSLQKHFPKTFITHALPSMLRMYQAESKKEHHKKVYAHFISGMIVITFFEGDQLIFCNSFAYQNTQDVVYFLLLVCDQFRLNQESIPLICSGEIVKDSEIFRQASRYFQSIQWLSLPNATASRLGTVFQEYPQHLFADILSINTLQKQTG